MDNERYTLDKSDPYICETCGFWKAHSINMGFCNDVNNSNDETYRDSWCENWKERIE